MTTAPPLDQITLPGQAATVPGPLDMTGMYVMHHAFRRDLGTLGAAVSVTPVVDRETWQALARRWELFADVLHHHHDGEDRGYWPLLRTRATAAEREVLDAMEAEHAQIGPVLDACAAGFARMTTGGSRGNRAWAHDARRTLVGHLAEARSHLDAHLAHEETAALPLLHRYLTTEEDERIEAEYFRGGLPLTMILRVVPWALHEVPDDERRRVLRAAGVAYHVVWWMTRRRFQRENSRVVRHLRR
ncbi:MAG: hemerythrin domain-containing protein [Phycicoccus sp.]